jgi:hypothetical protein
LKPAIEIDLTTILRQAGLTAETNLIDGTVAIDEFFGRGFAREHPVLIGAFMQATATVYAGEIIAREIAVGFDGIAEALQAARLNLGTVAEKVCGTSPVQAESFDGVSGALRELVKATQKIAAMMNNIGMQMPTQHE